MGSLISSLVAEIFLQHYKDIHIKQLLDTKNIALYTRYVDAILIIYDITKIQPQTINKHINQIPDNIKLNPTQETHNSINFFDLKITRNQTSLEIDIYRKPTTTDMTINFHSNHPIEHKMAAFRFHISRMHCLPLDSEKKQKDRETIQTIAKNNNFPQNLLLKLKRQIQHKTSHTQTRRNDKKLRTTYHSPKIRKITNLFKNTNIVIAFRTTTTLRQLTKPIPTNQTLEHENSGVYKLSCKICQQSYIAQTSRNLKSRFWEHTRYIKNNYASSAYALHILNCRHEYGNINDTTTLLKRIDSPSLLLPYKQMYIQLFHYNKHLIQEQHPNEHNLIYQLLYDNTKRCTHRDIHSTTRTEPVHSQPAHHMTTNSVNP